ncbi:Neurofibromin 1 [Homalodisca vitripennis]|nr:Neurofibromin 1 [Homalodisca vitripennis]
MVQVKPVNPYNRERPAKANVHRYLDRVSRHHIHGKPMRHKQLRHEDNNPARPISHACMRDIPDCDWLQTWTSLSKCIAFCFNPALQPRALIVFGCISKTITDLDIKQLLRILVKALESFNDMMQLEAIIMCLTRLQPLLRPESPIHKALFWVGVSVLQLDQMNLYHSGLALLEQNLHTLDSQGIFEDKPLAQVMMSTREPLEWHFKQLDHAVGLSFKANFHFALVGHLLKGFRHPTPTTVSRTSRILTSLLAIVAKPHKRDKFEVTPESVAYLAALVPVSEEVRNRCHVKHTASRLDIHLNLLPQVTASLAGNKCEAMSSSRRQKSWDLLDQSAIAQARQHKQQTQVGPYGEASCSNKGWRSLDLAPPPPRPLYRTQRSSSVPAPSPIVSPTPQSAKVSCMMVYSLSLSPHPTSSCPSGPHP